MRNMFFTTAMNRVRPVSRLPYSYKRNARLGNLFLGRRAEGLRVNRQFSCQLAIAENLDRVRSAAHKSMRAKQLWRNRLSGWKNVQFLQVHDGIRHAKRVMKTALRHAPVQRHLSAFKPTAARITAA